VVGIGSNSTVAIDIKNLSAGYDSETIIENVNLQINHKDFFGIIGPNGGGKSTLLKAILGLIPIQKGSIQVFGKPPEQGRKYIGYVPQYAEFDKHFPISVWDVVLMGRRSIRGMSPWYSQKDKQSAEQALKKVELLDCKNRHISELSGGQRQRVFIARAMAANPRILLLDEPTASVDKDMQETIYQFLQEINKQITIVLVTHDIGVLSSYVNRVSCMNRYLFTHDDDRYISPEMIEKAYSCPVDLIAHGVPHRVLVDHDQKKRKKTEES
jgi:zinc transport system ATP-binding protein